MIIGLVLPAIPTYSETFFRNKIIGLQQNGVQVKLFVNSFDQDIHDLNCKVYSAPILHGHFFVVTWQVLKMCVKALFLTPKRSWKLFKLNNQDGLSLKDNFKLLIANQFLFQHDLDWLHFGFGTMALKREHVAEVIGAKMAVSFRGFDLGVYPLKHPGCYHKLFKKVDKIHVISNDLKTLLYKQGLKNKQSVVKITPAIDLSFFQKTTDKKDKGDTIKLMSIGRLHWKKGFEDTLEALAILKNQEVAFHYDIIGEGQEFEALLFAVHQLQLQDHVTFRGKLSRDEVKACLEQSDVYIQYSKQEGFCNAVLEAQAMGCLCVVSDAEGLAENVLDSYTGWVVPMRQPEMLAKKLKDIQELDKTQQQQICNQAITHIRNGFGLEVQIEKFLTFYEIQL